MIGLVGSRARVLDLRIQYFEHGDCCLLAMAVGDADGADPFLLSLGIDQVFDQLRETALLDRFHGDMPDDHAIRPKL
ncbi:hypothetical protein GCM10008020_39440 [Massilia psychrophila]|nr:hypothetical protein GCM10008020_39440 [Massilia psychrophila]